MKNYVQCFAKGVTDFFQRFHRRIAFPGIFQLLVRLVRNVDLPRHIRLRLILPAPTSAEDLAKMLAALSRGK